MKKRVMAACLILTALVLCGTGTASAKMKVPGRTSSWVNDYAGIIDAETKGYIEGLVSSIKQKTKDPVEVVIGTFRSIEGWDFREFVTTYAEEWRRARRGKRDNGVTIVVFTGKSRIAIIAGDNLKEILPPTFVNGIIRDIIVPEFNKGNYSAGIKKAVQLIVTTLNEAKIPSGPMVVGAASRLIISILVLALLFMLFTKPATHVLITSSGNT